MSHFSLRTIMCKFRLLFACVLAIVFASVVRGCDLEEFSPVKQVSIEESTIRSSIVIRGISRPSPTGQTVRLPQEDTFWEIFDLVATYKGADFLTRHNLVSIDSRTLNVTFPRRQSIDCQIYAEIPTQYIVFCELTDDKKGVNAVSIAKWDENADQRAWTAIGWSDWSEWSSCSELCSMGIQQRVRHCLKDECSGYNVEQRHCNMFGCVGMVDPLTLADGSFFHPSKERWERVPDRPAAWRLNPNSYIWVPSSQLFNNTDSKTFPGEFVLFITMRIDHTKSSMGTIFSLRSRRREDSYLSLELAESDLKLIHAGPNGTDVVRIPTTLLDGKWHQIAISVTSNTVVDSYVDCVWTSTDVLKRNAFQVPEDSDLIIGYLFTGDLEQLTISPYPHLIDHHCDQSNVAIYDHSTKDKRVNTRSSSSDRANVSQDVQLIETNDV